MSTSNNMSDYLENKLLDHSTGKTAYTKPDATYCALYTAAPSDSGGGTEVSGGAYARQAVTWGNAASGTIANSAAIEFPTATASWGAVTHYGIHDASTGGNLLYWGALDESKTVGSGDSVSVAVGALTQSLN